MKFHDIKQLVKEKKYFKLQLHTLIRQLREKGRRSREELGGRN